jgi:hypothetical protein
VERISYITFAANGMDGDKAVGNATGVRILDAKHISGVRIHREFVYTGVRIHRKSRRIADEAPGTEGEGFATEDPCPDNTAFGVGNATAEERGTLLIITG